MMNLLSKTQLYFHISLFSPQAADFQECWQHNSLFQTYMFQVLVYSGVAWNLQKKLMCYFAGKLEITNLLTGYVQLIRCGL